MKKLLIIGPAPHNIGGVSVHIRRLVYLLKSDYEIDFVDEGHNRYDSIYNIRSLNLFKYLKLIKKADVVHIHSGVNLLRFFHILVARLFFRKKTVVTIHRDISVENHLKLTRWFLSQCNCAILVNNKSYDLLYKPCKCRYMVLPAFIPPVPDEYQPLPNDVTVWINSHKLQNPQAKFMVANAGDLAFRNGKDVYGLDFCIDAWRVMSSKKEPNNFYLIFVVASDSTGILNQYQEDIDNAELNNCILLWRSGLSFVSLVRDTDMVLRPTITDGDALTVREGLYLDKPVIASDVITRPVGTIMYKVGDVDDFVQKIKAAQEGRIILKQTDKDWRTTYLDLYKSI